MCSLDNPKQQCIAGVHFNKESLSKATKTGANLLSGRTLLDLAKKVLKHGKFSLAFRKGYMQGVTAQDPVGQFPSGKKQNDADDDLIAKVKRKIAGETNVSASNAIAEDAADAIADDDARDLNSIEEDTKAYEGGGYVILPRRCARASVHRLHFVLPIWPGWTQKRAIPSPFRFGR